MIDIPSFAVGFGVGLIVGGWYMARSLRRVVEDFVRKIPSPGQTIARGDRDE